MRHELRHGCGHFWMIATLHYDDYDQISEGWCYWPQERALAQVDA